MEMKAVNKRLSPYIATCDKDEKVFKCPNLGNDCPTGWKLIEELFVDKSGFGAPSESALTADQFLAKVKKHQGYAIIEEGQFQLYIGVFEKV